MNWRLESMTWESLSKPTSFFNQSRSEKLAMAGSGAGWVRGQTPYYPLVMTKIAIENGPVEIVSFPLNTVIFHSLNSYVNAYQRVPYLNICICMLHLSAFLIVTKGSVWSYASMFLSMFHPTWDDQETFHTSSSRQTTCQDNQGFQHKIRAFLVVFFSP